MSTTIRIAVESAEVAVLKADGRPWDGLGGARVPHIELAAFFASDLTTQLGHLVSKGDPPTPPDVFVRFIVDGEVVYETSEQKSFEPDWPEDDGPPVELPSATRLTIQVWDRDVLFNDNIGELSLTLPSTEAGLEELRARGRWVLGPFGQVRKLVLRAA